MIIYQAKLTEKTKPNERPIEGPVLPKPKSKSKVKPSVAPGRKQKGRDNPDDDFPSPFLRKEKGSAVEPSEPLIDEPIVTDVTEDKEPDGQELPSVKK